MAILTLDDIAREAAAAAHENDPLPTEAAHHDLAVFDLHCDTLDRTAQPLLPPDLIGDFDEWPEPAPVGVPGEPFDLATTPFHINLQQTEGVDWCQCFAVFIPDGLSPEQALAFFELVAPVLAAQCELHPARLEQARDARDINAIVEQGKMAALLTVENAKMLAAAPDALDRLASADVKMASLSWNRANPLASGHETSEGLTRLGRSMIRGLEKRRIVLDVSHLNDEGFRDVLECSTRPFVASHSNARAVCPHARNLTDDQIRAIAERGGVIGLNYCNEFLTWEHDDPTFSDVMFQVDHLITVGGEGVLALGSDYDGCDTPSWLVPCNNVRNLHDLLATELGDELAERVMWGNAHDFFVRNETA